MSLTVSITQKCNSRCKTCNIWQVRQTDSRPELSLVEYDRLFKSIGPSVIWYTLSGGEPFLREDIVDIVKLIKKYSNPRIINIPTNGILTRRIVESTEGVIKALGGSTSLIVNLSLDGIEEKHDEIRGVKGNFSRFNETIYSLKELQKSYPHGFEIGIHTVVSVFNVADLLELFKYVRETYKPDSYICEIAENREELFTTYENITPPVSLYEEVIRPFQEELRESFLKNKGLTGLIQAFRLKYYDYVVAELKERKRQIPCYAGQVSAQISPWGDVWPCCILAYSADMGNLRDFGFDFAKLWYSDRAVSIRNKVHSGDCYCPMANVHYTNMALTPGALIGVARNYLMARV